MRSKIHNVHQETEDSSFEESATLISDGFETAGKKEDAEEDEELDWEEDEEEEGGEEDGEVDGEPKDAKGGDTEVTDVDSASWFEEGPGWFPIGLSMGLRARSQASISPTPNPKEGSFLAAWTNHSTKGTSSSRR